MFKIVQISMMLHNYTKQTVSAKHHFKKTKNKQLWHVGCNCRSGQHNKISYYQAFNVFLLFSESCVSNLFLYFWTITLISYGWYGCLGQLQTQEEGTRIRRNILLRRKFGKHSMRVVMGEKSMESPLWASKYYVT